MVEYIIETQIAMSGVELPHFENLSEETNPEYIFLPEPLAKKDRKDFSEDCIEIIQEDWMNVKGNYSDSNVIGIIQFPRKRRVRDIDKIERAVRCSLYDGSDGVCLYESDLNQDEVKFSEEVEGFLLVVGDTEKYLILDMETKEPRKKLEIALLKGIKNIILFAGAYRDAGLWEDLIMNIRASEGKSFIMLPRNMNTWTKKSYIEIAQIFGADFVFQGFMYGGGKGKKKNYFLDKSDMTFKKKSELPATALVFSDEHFRNFERQFQESSDEETSLSRVCSFKEAELYCRENRRTIIL